MIVACLDLEGVLVPEIWINVAERTGIAELRRTTRDEPDYDKLMRARLAILDRHKLGLREIQAVIDTLEPLPGALAGGVRVAFGTDAGVYPHGENAREFQYMVEAGMTPAAAIESATKSAATVLGLDTEIGTLEVGKRADLVATKRNPLVDVMELQRIVFVMRGGTVYRRE